MTEKIYDTDAYCQSFQAQVISCGESKNGFELILDRTAFYPEGGGQPGDYGSLALLAADGSQAEIVRIKDTQEKDGDVIHLAEQYVEPGTLVQGQIDWIHRFDLMQNHSGEHIVSGLIHARYGYNNVGFHMGSDTITVDLDGEFSVEDMREFERQANQIVWANTKTDIRVYSEEEVKKLEYRSKKELHGQVRIVTFEGADTCACCGTHVRYTGEIGLIKLISLEKFREGVRMEMLCGRRALNYMNEMWEQNRQISVMLSAKPGETAAAVMRLKESAQRDSIQMAQMEARMFEEKAQQLKGTGKALLFQEGLSADSVRRLAVAVMETCGGRCAVFSGSDEEGYKYALGEKDGDLRELIKQMNTALNGRGGGKPFFAQGSVKADQKAIREFFEFK